MIKRSRTTIRDHYGDDIQETLRQLHEIDKRWEFKLQVGTYNVYKLIEAMDEPTSATEASTLSNSSRLD